MKKRRKTIYPIRACVKVLLGRKTKLDETLTYAP